MKTADPDYDVVFNLYSDYENGVNVRSIAKKLSRADLIRAMVRAANCIYGEVETEDGDDVLMTEELADECNDKLNAFAEELGMTC